MNSIIASIHPNWCDLILSRKKLLEIRKSVPKLQTPFKVYIYETKGSGSYRKGRQAVIGEFVCDKVIDIYVCKAVNGRVYTPNPFLKEKLYDSCLSLEDIYNYIGGAKGFGWHISQLVIYEEPLPLTMFYKPCVDKYEYCQSCKFGHISYPAWVETAEDLEYCLIETTCLNVFRRPPQSWGYTLGRRDLNVR